MVSLCQCSLKNKLCLYLCLFVLFCCSVLFFFWTVDTKVVLTAAILFSRYSPLTMTEWELLTKPLQWCYTRPGSNLYSGDSVLHVSHITTQSWTSSDLNSSSLCLSVYRQYLCSCLFSFHICSSFFSHSVSINLLYLFLSFSLSVCGSCLAISQWPFSSQQFKLRKKKNPLNVQPNSWKMRIQLLYTRKLRCS